MDELLRDFLTETHESVDLIDVELVRFEQNPNNAATLNKIFRLVHTIKGTCGFLNLPRLEALTHSAEALMGKFRDGACVTADAVTLILASIDRIKMLLDRLQREQTEPAGDDRDLIAALDRMSGATTAAPTNECEPPKQPLDERAIDEWERSGRAMPAPRSRPVSALPVTADAGLAGARLADVGAIEGGEGGGDEERLDSRLAGQSIRVHVDTLEHLMTTVSELVLTRNQLLDIVRRHENSEFKAPLQRLSNVTAELQEGIMKTRMQPIGHAWQKLPRIVRDLAAELGKRIAFEMQGAETELDRQVLDLIRDPLIHMVRNCADHGLEMPAERRLAGKPEQGSIRLAAWHEGGHIIVEISDDGRGLDSARIRSLAIARGLVSEADASTMTDVQVQKFIFLPGFSTAAKITSVSGRGVGMDVVRANLDRIGGAIDVMSVPGQGTSFTIKIPLTLAIVSALIVECEGDRFAIPQLAVVELVRARNNAEHRIERIKDAAVLRLRNKLLPLLRLGDLLRLSDDDRTDNGFIVVMQVGSQTFGLLVDSVFHTEEIVVKPMSAKLRHIAMFCGNTILGDGSVIMIIDPNGIAQNLSGAVSARLAVDTHDERNDENGETESMLLFRAGSPNPKAVLLSLVTRLEVVDPRSIETANGRPVLQYRGQLMPLIPADADMRIKSAGAQPLLVFSNEGRSMGLLVDEIVDIVEGRLEIELGSATAGILGSAVVKGQATEVIDLAHYLPLAFEDWQQWSRCAGAPPRQVLLVDDTAFFRNMLAPVLKAAGFAVTTAASADEAIALVQGGRRFDVVVTDIEMPGKDGFALASALRASPRTAGLPVIGLSSLVSADAIERGRAVGLHDYVAKFDRQGLIAALKEQTAEAVAA
ncbi:MAG: hybrid sensor histidine kinase/response regulator [Hyphomicrobiales bacterium]|nr:hybrid sensor histidine kinase/response regulator [Hyphomicrobiales bacterium]